MHETTALLLGVVAFLGAAIWRHRTHRTHRTHRMDFLARCEPTTRFIGQDIDFALAALGPYTFFGSMDFGEAVAQWRQDGVLLELWFKQGRCVSAEVR